MIEFKRLDDGRLTGQRGVGTWKERVRRLEKLGFLLTKPGISGSLHYVQLWNPYIVIKHHRHEKTEGFREDQYNALFERVVAIGAKDLEEPKPVINDLGVT